MTGLPLTELKINEENLALYPADDTIPAPLYRKVAISTDTKHVKTREGYTNYDKAVPVSLQPYELDANEEEDIKMDDDTAFPRQSDDDTMAMDDKSNIESGKF